MSYFHIAYYVDALTGECVFVDHYRPTPNDHPPAQQLPRPVRLHVCLVCDGEFEAKIGPVDCPRCGSLYVRMKE